MLHKCTHPFSIVWLFLELTDLSNLCLNESRIHLTPETIVHKEVNKRISKA